MLLVRFGRCCDHGRLFGLGSATISHGPRSQMCSSTTHHRRLATAIAVMTSPATATRVATGTTTAPHVPPTRSWRTGWRSSRHSATTSSSSRARATPECALSWLRPSPELVCVGPVGLSVSGGTVRHARLPSDDRVGCMRYVQAIASLPCACQFWTGTHQQTDRSDSIVAAVRGSGRAAEG
jgi:hypothetical protein